jgi:hypothetical protein
MPFFLASIQFSSRSPGRPYTSGCPAWTVSTDGGGGIAQERTQSGKCPCERTPTRFVDTGETQRHSKKLQLDPVLTPASRSVASHVEATAENHCGHVHRYFCCRHATDCDAQTFSARLILLAWSSCSAVFAGSPLPLSNQRNL